MRGVQSIDPSIPFRDRLSVRLGLLFLATFMGTLIVMGAWAVLTAIDERSQSAEELSIQSPAIVIDPKIQSDLAKALAFDAIPAETQVQNPFLDRAGLSGNLAAPNAGNRPNVATQASLNTSTIGATSGSTPSNMSATLGPGLSRVFVPESYDTKARYGDWLERQRRGEFVEPESEILAVEDLVPVGYASGGERGAEVILFSASLCRTFSFPTGTRFYNGLLNGFDQTEVVFVFQNGLRRKSYSTAETCRPALDPRATGTTN